MREHKTQGLYRWPKGTDGVDQILDQNSPEEAHVSLYIAVDSTTSNIDVRRRLIDLTLRAEKLLCKNWDQEDVDDLLKDVYDGIKHIRVSPGVRGVAIFRRYDIFRVFFLRTPPPDLYVVASSFHVKPLLHCRTTQVDCLLIRMDKNQIKLEQVDSHGTRLLASYQLTDAPLSRDLKNFAKQVKKGQRLIGRYIAIIGDPTTKMAVMQAFGSGLAAKFFTISEADAADQGVQQAVVSALLFYINKDNAARIDRIVQMKSDVRLLTNIQQIARAAAEGNIEVLYVDPHLQEWGTIKQEPWGVTTYHQQKSLDDDCVIDDCVESVLRSGGRIEFFDHNLSRIGLKYLAISKQ